MLKFAKTLIEWYEVEKRELPWRNTRDPYKVWLSEIILQQTRVQQGLPYYLKFLKLFPSVHELANATEEQVLNAWKGLGYYSRARSLHYSAKKVNEEFKGVFPTNFSELKKLKGVGDYTAAAIASFCFKEVVPVVDGNVYRVLARLFDLDTAIDSTTGKKEFFSLAQELISDDFPDIFNQALMEFGALQCVPKKPNCLQCVFKDTCEAYARNKVSVLPVKSKKIKKKKRYFTYLLIQGGGGFWVSKRGDEGIWANMYEFPLVETKREVFRLEDLSLSAMEALPFDFELINNSVYKKHVLTHQDIFYTFWKVKLLGKISEKYKFCSKKELENLPFPKLLENYISNA